MPRGSEPITHWAVAKAPGSERDFYYEALRYAQAASAACPALSFEASVPPLAGWLLTLRGQLYPALASTSATHLEANCAEASPARNGSAAGTV
jgi:hypothetical protein